MDPVKQYLANIGRKGGRASGSVKARNPETMREAQKKSVEVRKRNQAKAILTNGNRPMSPCSARSEPEYSWPSMSMKYCHFVLP